MKQHYHSYQIHFTLGSCLMESSLLPVCFDTVYYRNACLLCLFHSNLSRSARSAHLLLLALGGGASARTTAVSYITRPLIGM